MRLTATPGQFGPGGAALGALSAATIAIGLVAPPHGGLATIAQWAVSLVLVLCLARVALPMAMRATLIAALLGVALGDAASADPIRTATAMRRIDADLAAAKAAGDRAVAAAAGPRSALHGAHVALDGSWGHRIADALDDRIGGTAAGPWSIVGEADARPEEERTRVTISWSIGGNGARVSCGTTTILGPDEGGVIDAARASFEHAVTRTVAAKGPACA